MGLFNFFRRKGTEDEKVAELAASAIAKGGVEGLSDYVFGRAEHESKLISESIARNMAGQLRPGMTDPNRIEAVLRSAYVIAFCSGHIIGTGKTQSRLVIQLDQRAVREIPDFKELSHRANVFVQTEASKMRELERPEDVAGIIVKWAMTQELVNPGEECKVQIDLLTEWLFGVTLDSLAVEGKCKVVDVDTGEEELKTFLSETPEAPEKPAEESLPGDKPWLNEFGEYLCEKCWTGDCPQDLKGTGKCPADLFFEATERGKIKDWEKALPKLRHVVEMAPDFGQAWCNLGICQFETGRVKESRESLLRAVRHLPSHQLTRNCWSDVNSRLLDMPGQANRNLFFYLTALATKLGDLPREEMRKPHEDTLDAGRHVAEFLVEMLVEKHRDGAPADVADELEVFVNLAIARGMFSVIWNGVNWLTLHDCGLDDCLTRLNANEEIQNTLFQVVTMYTKKEFDLDKHKTPKGLRFCNMIYSYAFLGTTECIRWMTERKGDINESLKLMRRALAGAYCFGYEFARELMKDWE